MKRMIRFTLWLLLFSTTLVVSQISACGGPASSRFAIEFCKKGYPCKDKFEALAGGAALFQSTFGIGDQAFCENLWTTRLSDPLDAGKTTCRALEADLTACLKAIETLDCQDTKAMIEQKCNFCTKP